MPWREEGRERERAKERAQCLSQWDSDGESELGRRVTTRRGGRDETKAVYILLTASRRFANRESRLATHNCARLWKTNRSRSNSLPSSGRDDSDETAFRQRSFKSAQQIIA